MHTIPPFWPFAMWLRGSVPNYPGGYRYILVAVNKFTK
jgi:hypothetical protein